MKLLESRNLIMELTKEEEEAITIVYDLIVELIHNRPDVELMSPISGEIIMTKELGRTLGILDGLVENNFWEINTKEDK